MEVVDTFLGHSVSELAFNLTNLLLPFILRAIESRVLLLKEVGGHLLVELSEDKDANE